MTDDDTLTMTGFRRGVDSEIAEELTGLGLGVTVVDSEIAEELTGLGLGVTVVDWWEALGWEEEGGLKGLRMSGVVGEDGVHLVPKANRDAAVFFLHRLADLRLQSGDAGGD